MPSSNDFNRFRNLPGKSDLTVWSQSAAADRYFRLFLFAWILPLVTATIYVLLSFSDLPRQVPLFYSRPWGETQLASRAYIFSPLAGAFLLGVFDFGLAVNFHARNRIISYFLAGTAALVAFLCVVTVLNTAALMK